MSDLVNTGRPILTIALPLMLVNICHAYIEKGHSCHEFCLNGMAHFGVMGVFGFAGLSDLVNTGHPVLEGYSFYKE